MAVDIQVAQTTGPHRFVACSRYKRNLLRLVPGGATIVCKSCREPHFFTRAELNALWDALDREQAQIPVITHD